MSSAFCQKYQDVILHLVAFLQCASQHASLALLTHNLLHNRRYATSTERAREHRQMTAHSSCISERTPFSFYLIFPIMDCNRCMSTNKHNVMMKHIVSILGILRAAICTFLDSCSAYSHCTLYIGFCSSSGELVYKFI